MYLREGNIIQYFDEVIQNEIRKFCQRINESDADVFILMARKAACFFQVLMAGRYIDQGLANRKMIIMDRAVDFSNNYLNGKKVLIIDDVIFSGSTIAKMCFRLRDCGVREEDISILVLATNKDTFKMNFRKEAERELFRTTDSAKLGDADCTRLCGDISKMLSMIGKPYDVDFPAYHDFELESGVIPPWTCLPQYWDMYNISNEYHRQVGIEAYTLIPSKVILDNIWNFLHMDLGNVAIYKVKIYCYESGEKKRCKIVPMMTFHEISSDTLESIFDHVCEALETPEIKIKEFFSSDMAKIRFLQYLVADLLAMAFYRSCGILVTQRRKYSIPSLFGYDCPDKLTAVLDGLMKKFLKEFGISSSERRECVAFFHEDYCNKLGYEAEEDGMFSSSDVNLKLLRPFLYWYDNTEVPAREKLANPEIDLTDESFFENIRRLEMGFSMRALMEIIKSAEEIYETDKLVSTFVDRAVDLGLLVPIIYNNKDMNTFCRAYRHGEDLPFGDDEKTKLCSFLKVFYDSSNGNILSKIQFQKITALFLHMGLRNGLFNCFLGFDNSQLLTVKYCIHGAVPVVVNNQVNVNDLHPYVKKNEYSEWLSERMEREGYIRITRTGIEITDEADKCMKQISADEQLKIKMLAIVLARWFDVSCRNHKRTEFTQSLIILTSCLNVESFSSAILAEMYICRMDWQNNLCKILYPVNEENCRTALNYFTKKMRRTNVFTAMNSGRRKYLWYEKDENGKNAVHQVVQMVAELFNAQGEELYALNWLSQWNDFLTVDQSRDFIDCNIMECVGHIYCYNICYRILEYLFLKLFLGKKERLEKTEKEITDLVEEYEELGLNQNRVNELLRISKYSVKEGMQMAYDYMLNLDDRAATDMMSIEQFVSKTSRQYLVKYSSCVVFDFGNKNSGEAMGIVLKAMRAVNRSECAFEMEEKDFSRICVLFNEDNPKQFLVSLIKNVYILCQSETVRVIAFPILPEGREFRLNCKVNMRTNSVDFREKIILPTISKARNHKPYMNEVMFLSKCGDGENEPSAEDRNSIESSGVRFIESSVDKANIPYCKEEFYCMKYSGKSKMTVGIITVIPQEFNAVKEKFQMKEIKSDESSKGRRKFYGAVISENDTEVKLIMTQAQGQGNMAGESAFYGLCNNFQLDYVILVGIAGSVNEKTAKIGDVVIARAVWDGQLGKETPDGFQPETKLYTPNAIVNSILVDFMNEASQKKYPNHSHTPHDSFSCVYEPIGNNNHLIADKDSRFVTNMINNVDRKVTAVEMESAGVSYGVYQALLDGLCQNLIVIKGISDYADPDKSPDDKFHKPASENAVVVMCDLLLHLI